MMLRSIFRQSVRTAKTKTDKIPVQLLQPVSRIGRTGEIVRVRPAYMRNFLHADNKACYITKTEGPRIPVVAKPQRTEPKKAKKPKAAVKTKTTQPVMTLEELSLLFTPKADAAGFDMAASGLAFLVAGLADALPESHVVSGLLMPVTKAQLVQSLFMATGFEVPVEALSIRHGDSFIEKITAPGAYQWQFKGPEDQAFVRRLLVVE